MSPNDAEPPWVQPGITDVPAARAFLAAASAADTLVLSSNDGDPGHAMNAHGRSMRGHGITIAHNLIAATPPPAELAAHHRIFGLGATRIVCPRPTSTTATLAELALADGELVARLRADRSLARIMVSYKSAHAARLIAALDLAPVWSDPSPDAYAGANDKLALARAGAQHGFDTLPAEPIPDAATLAARFDALAAHYGQGCIVRTARGSSGRNIHHARDRHAAERFRRSLATHGTPVLLLPYVPPALVLRNVATHGLVTAEGFAPFAFTDQILRGPFFRGGHVAAPWSAAEIAAVRAALAGVTRWFRDLGYTGAPAGVDGFLMAGSEGPRFVVLDPNARWSATMQPWAVITRLIEQAGRPLVWCFEGFRLIGLAPTLARMRRRLGGDLLAPQAIERGGVLPTLWTGSGIGIGPAGVFQLWAILLGRDADHLDHLRRRVRSLGLIAR